MPSTNRQIQPVMPPMSRSCAKIPRMIYGTAWKEERSQDLVVKALQAGFRALDTAPQRKHYRQDLVGQGIREVIARGIVKREDLYIQTKYTPYLTPNSDSTPESITASVKSSVESSLHELRTAPDTSSPSTLDCLVLHSPLSTPLATLTAWRAMESLIPSRVTRLGISNTTLPLLSALHSAATIKPVVVQNRFHAATRYDGPVRAFCRTHDIRYQSFWTLTANPGLLRSRPVETLRNAAKVSREVALYHFVLQLGDVSMLNGTTSEVHMERDLEQVGQVQAWMEDGGNAEVWAKAWREFGMLIGEVGS